MPAGVCAVTEPHAASPRPGAAWTPQSEKAEVRQPSSSLGAWGTVGRPVGRSRPSPSGPSWQPWPGSQTHQGPQPGASARCPGHTACHPSVAQPLVLPAEASQAPGQPDGGGKAPEPGSERSLPLERASVWSRGRGLGRAPWPQVVAGDQEALRPGLTPSLGSPGEPRFPPPCDGPVHGTSSRC